MDARLGRGSVNFLDKWIKVRMLRWGWGGSEGRMYTRNKDRMYTRTTLGSGSYAHAAKIATTRE